MTSDFGGDIAFRVREIRGLKSWIRPGPLPLLSGNRLLPTRWTLVAKALDSGVRGRVDLSPTRGDCGE
jgi:hypothetical protein